MRWFGDRRSYEPIKANGSAVGKPPDSIDRVARGNFHQGVPISEHLEQRDLSRAEPLIPAFRARCATHEVDSTWTPGSSSRNCNRLAPRHLGGQTERKSRAPTGGAGTWAADDFVGEAIRRWGSHAQAGWRSTPVEPSPNATELSGLGEPRERLRNRIWRCVEVHGTPEAITGREDPLPDRCGHARFTHA